MQGIVRRLRRLSDVIATFGAANATFGAANATFGAVKFPVSYPSFVSETKTTNWAGNRNETVS